MKVQALVLVVVAGWVSLAGAQEAATTAVRPKFESFEVSSVKLVDPEAANEGRYFRMVAPDRFVAKNYTLKMLIAVAYGLNPKTVLGGPGWMDADHYDITATTASAVRPTQDEQRAMLRSLIAERFQLKFHRESKDYAIYALEVAKGGAKLRPAAGTGDSTAALIGMVTPGKVTLPARNTTMAEFAGMLQRAVLDRPVVDKTGVQGRFDFDLEWAPDSSQYGGAIPANTGDTEAPTLFTALEEQAGLKLTAMRGPAETLVVDGLARPAVD